MKDTTAFRERFNRWKAGEKVYEAGLPTYKDGKSSQFVDYLKSDLGWGLTWQDRMPKVATNDSVIVSNPTPDQINEHAITVENPTRKGYNPNGTWSQYDDPAGNGLKNVAAGLLVNNEAARKAGKVGVVPDKPFYTNEEVSKPWVRLYNEGWPNIAKEYDKKYGTSDYPHPSDTINLKTRLLATSTRGKSGNLNPEDWPNFYQAMADGDIAKLLVESRTAFGKNKDRFDNDRIRREAEALWPGRFNVTWDEKNPKKKAIVAPKFQGGKESEIYGGTLPEILVTPKGVGHNYEVTDNREMIPTGALYSDAERHEMEGKLGGDYVRENLHKAAPVIFDLLSSVELIANPMATASAVKGLYNVVRHPRITTQNIMHGLKNPFSMKKGILHPDEEKFINDLKAGKYKMKPVPKDEIVTKPKLPTQIDHNVFKGFDTPSINNLTDKANIENNLEYILAKDRLDQIPNTQYPPEVKNAIKDLIISRRLQNVIDHQRTDGVQKMKEYMNNMGFSDIDVSSPNDLKELRFGDFTLEELEDWANYRLYKLNLENYVDGKFLRMDPKDYDLIHPFNTNVVGDYDPITDKIRVKDTKDYDKWISRILHEVRHKIDKHIPLNYSEENIIRNVYGNFENVVDPKEFITTNTDLRNDLLKSFYADDKSLFVQNTLLNHTDTDTVLHYLEHTNGYGQKMINSFNERMNRLRNIAKGLGWSEEQISNKIALERSNFADDLKLALTKVGILTGSTYIPAKTLLNPANSKKKK